VTHVCRGNYFMAGNRLNKTMGIGEAFRLSLQTVKTWELSSTRVPKGYFFFRSYSPSHYMYVIRRNICIIPPYNNLQ
jgi:hypothetical protein